MLDRARSWFAGWFLRNRMEREMSEELEFHFQARTEHLTRQGLSSEEARRQARIEFGAAERYKDECRESRGLRLLDECRGDALFALRGIRRSPGFSTVVVLSLALGIGANTAIFSIVNGILLRPLPYKDQERLVSVSEAMPQSMITLKNFRMLPYVNVLLHRDDFASFEDMIAMDHAFYQLVDVAEPEELEAAWVTSNVCSFLGVQPVLGRCFTGEEERSRAQVTMISYSLWQRQFGGDPDVVGRTVPLTAYSGPKSMEVIGVLPPRFQIGWKADLWIPLSESGNYRSRNQSWNPALTIARLKRGVDARQARAELLAAQRRMFPKNYEGAGGLEIRVLALPEYLAQSVKTGLEILAGIVGLVLLITCVNVANLLLSRGAGRLREMAVRASLGAGRMRICRQMLTEAAMLAAIGGMVGLVVANWMVKGVKALALERLPRVDDIHLDWTVLAFTALVSLASGILFGLLPALRLSRLDLADAMKSGGSAALGGRRQQRLMNSLVVAEIALCVIALTGAGLFISTFIRLKSVDAGFRIDRVLVASLNSPTDPRAEPRLYPELLERVRAIPGVEAAGLVNYPPPMHVRSITDFRLQGSPGEAAGAALRANARVVSPGYFQVMGIPILRGRPIEERDQANSPRVVVVSQGVAQRYWRDHDPIGQSIIVQDRRNPLPAQIVGVARDVRQTGLRDEPDDMIYIPYTQEPTSQNLVILTNGDPAALSAAVKTAVRAVDRTQTFRRLTTMKQMLAGEVAEPRFYMVLLGAYGALALLLTTIGVGGVVAYSVSRRTQEIGLRVSFGATSSDLLWMFSRGVAGLAVLGLMVGIPGSLAVTRLMRGMLFGVEPSDPLTLGLVAVVLTVVSLAACCSAAFKATRVEPTLVLRHE